MYYISIAHVMIMLYRFHCYSAVVVVVVVVVVARFHYGDDALLRDAEQSGIVIQLLRGLAVLNLPYDYAGYKLDTWDHAVLMLAGIWEGPDSRPTSHEKTSPKSAASPSRFVGGWEGTI